MFRTVVCLIAFFTVPLQVSAKDDLVATAASNGSFRTLVNLLVATGLDDDLRAKGHFTVFAPTDEAFAKLPPETLKSLLKPENREQLSTILKYHVVAKSISVPKTNRGHRLTSAKTLAGPELTFTRKGEQVSVNEAKIVLRNVTASNGYIQVIDSVLLPPKDESVIAVAAEAGNFKTLLAAIEAAGLTKTLQGKGPFTVFAPTDKAFAKLPKGTLTSLLKKENKGKLAAILKYHVVSGQVSARDAVQAQKAKTLEGSSTSVSIRDGRLFINDAGVLANDVKAANAVIHIIDSVLIPSEKKSERSASGSQKKLTITATWKDNIVRDGIEADLVEVICNSAGRVKLTNLKARKLITKVKGGGSVTTTGEVTEHEALVYGGARVDAAKLTTLDTMVTVYGGGNASVAASRTLEISANA
ncbi:MAG: fasciclin domain-containing protein, partial [Planctomycetaceae bacterium]